MLNNPDRPVTFTYKKNKLILQPLAAAFEEFDFQVMVVEMSPGFVAMPTELIPATGTRLNWHNAIKHYSYSTIDYYNNHRSVVKLSWTLAPSSNEIKPIVYLTEGEIGRSLNLRINGTNVTVEPNKSSAIPMGSNPTGLSWQNPYLAGPARGSFDRTHGPVGSEISTQAAWGANLQWKLQEQTDSFVVSGRPRESVYYLQEVSSEIAQPALIRIYSGDALQVWLNGEELAMHNHPRDSSNTPDLLLLNLKPGKNQLLVKFYNRYKYTHRFAVDTQPNATMYQLALPEFRMKAREINMVELLQFGGKTPHDPARLTNVSIQL